MNRFSIIDEHHTNRNIKYYNFMGKRDYYFQENNLIHTCWVDNESIQAYGSAYSPFFSTINKGKVKWNIFSKYYLI